MSKEEKKNKRNGLIVSIVAHAALLLIFAFYGLTYPDPPPPDEGFEINLGNTDFGKMTDNPNPPNEETQTEPIQENIPEPDPVETVEQDIVTQNAIDAPSIDKKKEDVKEKVEPVEKKPDPKPNKALSMADRMNSKNSKEQGGGDGTTDQAGDQGKANGDPNSTSYKGVGGNGNGVSFNLSGRSRKSTPTIKDNSQDEGTVVVEIIVDRYGKVVRATPGARGSNTTSAVLYKKAAEAALATKFNAKPDALEEQKGTMTFIFILN